MGRDTGLAKLQNEYNQGAWSPRAVRINGWRYTGMMEPDLVTRAICAGFTKTPDECSQLLAARNPFEKYFPSSILEKLAEGESIEEVIGGGVSFGSMTGLLFITLLVAFAGLLCYKRSLKKEMRRMSREEVFLEVQGAMEQYSQMQER